MRLWHDSGAFVCGLWMGLLRYGNILVGWGEGEGIKNGCDDAEVSQRSAAGCHQDTHICRLCSFLFPRNQRVGNFSYLFYASQIALI
jgi:hypothetical protein